MISSCAWREGEGRRIHPEGCMVFKAQEMMGVDGDRYLTPVRCSGI